MSLLWGDLEGPLFLIFLTCSFFFVFEPRVHRATVQQGVHLFESICRYVLVVFIF